MSRNTKERCEHCGKILRLGGTLIIKSAKIGKNTPRNTDGTLKRSREVEYKKVCVNPRCPGPPPEEEEPEQEVEE